MPQQRIRLTTPYGTSHVVEIDDDIDISKLTESQRDRIVDRLIQAGVITIDPGVVKGSVLRHLAGLKPESRGAWLRLLNNREKVPGSIAVSFTPEEVTDLFGGSPSSLVRVAVQGMTLHIKASDMRVLGTYSEMEQTAVVMERLEQPLRAATPNVPQKRFAPPSSKVEPIYSPHVNTARAVAAKYGIPEDLFLAMITQESRWRERVVSRAGAIGLGQLMPGTAKELGVDPYVPEENLEGAARYLRKQYDEFGDWKLALAAYNAGPGRVRQTLKDGKYSIPNIRETRNYVASVTALASRMPVASRDNQVRERARVMVGQQLRISPGQDPKQVAAIVHARLTKENLVLPPPRDPRQEDYWSFLASSFSGKVDFESHDVLTNEVLSTMPGDTPATRALARDGFVFDFGRSEFLRSPYIDTSVGRVPLPSPSTVNALFSPTENTALNVLTLGVVAGRLAVPVAGFGAGVRAAAGRGFMSAVGAGVMGAVRNEVRLLGAFDFTYAAAQVAPSVVLKGTVTEDDLKGAVMNVIPFVNILAPGIGDAFARNGVDGQIDWSGSALPSWYSRVMQHIVPTFQHVDAAVMLPALGLAGVLGKPSRQEALLKQAMEQEGVPGQADLPGQTGVLGAADAVAEQGIPAGAVDAGQAADTQAQATGLRGLLSRIPLIGGFFRAKKGEIAGVGVDGGDLATVASTRTVVVKALPQNYDVVKDTPDAILPGNVRPGQTGTVDTPDGALKVRVAVSRKTSTGVPFGYLHLADDSPPSAFEVAHRGIVEQGEGAVYSADRSVRGLRDEGIDERYLATAEAREAADGTIVNLPIVYRVTDVYTVAEVMRSPTLRARAAKAFGFQDVESFDRALQSDPPIIRVLEPGEGQPGVVGGTRSPAIDEDGFLVFVNDATYQGYLPEIHNPFVADVMRVVEHVRTQKRSLNDKKALRRAARALKVSDDVIRYIETADAISMTEGGAIVVRHSARPEIVSPDLLDAIHEGMPIDAGTATLLGRHGAIEGEGPRLTAAEADGLMSDLHRRRADGEDCP